MVHTGPVVVLLCSLAQCNCGRWLQGRRTGPQLATGSATSSPDMHILVATQQTFYIGPMSDRYTFLHRTDIGFHVGPTSDVQHGSMLDRCRLHIKNPYRSDVEPPCISMSARHRLFTSVRHQ